MIQFLKRLSSAIGLILCAIFIFGLSIFITLYFYSDHLIAKYVPGYSYSESAEGNVLKLSLSGKRSFFTPTVGIDWLDEQIELKSPFYTKLASIYKAAEDDQIKLLWLDCNGGLGGNQFDELQAALQYFKHSGKPIYASGEIINYSSYTLASFADSVFLSPTGFLNVRGLSTQDNYYKSILEKFGVEVEVFKQGKFKSAPSAYTAQEMDENDAVQTFELLSDVHEYRMDIISKNRLISVDSIESWINQFLFRNQSFALQNGLVDAIAYEFEVKHKIEEILQEEIQYTSYGAMSFNTALQSILEIQYPNLDDSDQKKIAILPLHGEIIEGAYRSGTISAKQLIPFLQSEIQEKEIDQLIIHWNSPGGSARGSEQIRAVLKEISDAIPVISYFSNIGASGAVLIASASDELYCSSNSIVGSIGVFALYPNFSNSLTKLDINREGVSTSKFANFGDPLLPMRDEDRAIIQAEVDKLYAEFLSNVGELVDLSPEQVDSFAQGRVYSGIRAGKETPLFQNTTISFHALLAQKISEIGGAEIEVLEMPQPLYDLDILSEISEFQTQSLLDQLVEEARKMQGNYAKLQFTLSE